MCPSRFHLPILLRSTVVTRFVATMRTLTPDPLLPAPDQVSLVHGRALPDIPSPPTPCVSAPAMLRAPGRLGPRFAFPAIGGSSDFAHCSQSRQSHKAVSSLCRGRSVARSSTDYLFTSSCSPRRVAGTQLLSVVWREAPPGRDSHPPVHACSQAHERRIYAAERGARRNLSCAHVFGATTLALQSPTECCKLPSLFI
jgi:hypothetical protein